MGALGTDQNLLASTARNAANVLALGLTLVMKRGVFGGPKPTVRQTGFSFGFAEAYANDLLNTNDYDRACFVRLVFYGLFAKAGDKLANAVFGDQHLYASSLDMGAQAFANWYYPPNRPPVPPRD
jgi:hypothetical protein